MQSHCFQCGAIVLSPSYCFGQKGYCFVNENGAHDTASNGFMLGHYVIPGQSGLGNIANRKSKINIAYEKVGNVYSYNIF